MADTRHRFVPTARAPERRVAARPVRAGTAWALALGAAVFLLRPAFQSPQGDAASRFSSRRAQFNVLKDMLLSEPAVTSVGPDNVREYWLFDGRWSSPRRPGVTLSRAEMLESVGLAPERYDAYLDLLKTVGGYRAVRAGRGPRVSIHLLPSSKRAGAPARAVYDPAAAGASPLSDGWRLETEKS